MAGHAVTDRSREAAAVLSDGVGVEAAAAVAHEDLDRVRLDLHVDVDLVDAGVLGGVHHRLPRRRDERGGVRVELGVADDDRRHPDPVVVLDLAGGGGERGGERRVGRSRGTSRVAAGRTVEPRPQLALLAAGEPADLPARRVLAGLLLDQRQRLEHRVVQVRGDVRALLAPDALAALGTELAHQAHPPRHRDDDDAAEGRERGEDAELDLPEVDVAEQEQRDAHGDEHRAREQPQQAEPASDEPPRPPSGLALDRRPARVGLAPHQRHADHDHGQRPDHPAGELAAETGQHEREQHAERREPETLAALAGRHLALDAARLDRAEQPQRGVGGEARAGGRDEQHEHEAHAQDVDTEVVGHPAAHARDHRAAAPAADAGDRRARRRRRGRLRGRGRHPGHRRGAGAQGRRLVHVDHRHTSPTPGGPGATPEVLRVVSGAGPGWLPDSGGRSLPQCRYPDRPQRGG